MRALDIAASGMAAQDLNVQVISNNIANMNTTGYKRQRAEFQDLLYEHVSRVGTQTSTQGNILPVGIDLGGGVKTVGTPRLITQGTLQQTGNKLDVAHYMYGQPLQFPPGTDSPISATQSRWPPRATAFTRPGPTRATAPRISSSRAPR